MTARIAELITTRDTSEVLRDWIAAILIDESIGQQELAAEADEDPKKWKLRVHLERSNPWADFLDVSDPSSDTTPIINVVLDRVDYDPSASSVVELQKGTGVYHVDCYGCGVSAGTTTGHDAGDKAAAIEAQRAKRLVRQILMAGHYAYLALRGTVGRRWLVSEQMFQPVQDDRPVTHVQAVRMIFNVDFGETSPQVLGALINEIFFTLKRVEDDKVIAEYLKQYS
jgi:hypothetical protein